MHVEWWNRPSTWGIGILALILICIFGLKKPVMVVKTTDESPVFVPANAPILQTEVKEKPKEQQIVVQKTDNNCSSGNLINGNENVIIQVVEYHVHYHQTPARIKRIEPEPIKEECEEQMRIHKAKLAQWDTLFKSNSQYRR